MLPVLKRFSLFTGVKGGGEENQDLVELAKFALSVDLTFKPGADASTDRSWGFTFKAGFDLLTACTPFTLFRLEGLVVVPLRVLDFATLTLEGFFKGAVLEDPDFRAPLANPEADPW